MGKRSVIVTGGGSGFGTAMCRAFASDGANVMVVDIDEDRASRVAADIREEGGDAQAHRCDVASAADVENLARRTFDVFGGADVLINNAGFIGASGAFYDQTERDYDTLFAVNCKSVVLCCKAFLPHFRDKRSGVVINIASGSALRPRAGAVLYAASKGAVIAFTRALAAEVAADGIRVNAICPAIARTPLAERFVGTDDRATWDELARQSPLGRLVQPDDVAGAAVFLASDAAAMITGTALAVDGGRCI